MALNDKNKLTSLQTKLNKKEDEARELRSQVKDLEEKIKKDREDTLEAFAYDFIDFLQENKENDGLIYWVRSRVGDNHIDDRPPATYEDGVPSINVFTVYEDDYHYDKRGEIGAPVATSMSCPEERVVVAFSIERTRVEDIIKKHKLDKQFKKDNMKL